MRRKFLSFFSYAAIACMSAFALTACGGDDNEPDAPDTPTGEATLVGSWISYEGGAKSIMTLGSDMNGTMAAYDVDTDELEDVVEIRWIALDNQFKLTYIRDGVEAGSQTYNIKRLDSEILIIYNDGDGTFSFINKNAEVTPTKEMMVGTWLEGYKWIPEDKIWRYDLDIFNSDGTGKYIDDAYLSELGGKSDEFEIKEWTLSGNTISEVCDGYKYAFDIKLASKNMLWVKDI